LDVWMKGSKPIRVEPVRRGSAPSEKSTGRQQERAGADGDQASAPGMGLRESLLYCGSRRGTVRAPAGNDDRRRLGERLEPCLGRDLQATCGVKLPTLFRDGDEAIPIPANLRPMQPEDLGDDPELESRDFLVQQR